MASPLSSSAPSDLDNNSTSELGHSEKSGVERKADNNDGNDNSRTHGAAAAPAVAVAQAYRSAYNETIAPPGGPLSRVIRPPIDLQPESKRAQLIEDAEVDLEGDMSELEAAVHAYNVDFQARIDAVKLRGRVLEDQIGLERQAMELAATQLHADFRKCFQSAFVSMEQRTLAHFARVESHQVASDARKLRECDTDFRAFAYTTVPAIMETLQGSITRKLEKNHETFDIENAKIQKRARKTFATLESTERKTDASFRTERARRETKFQERDEDMHDTMRVDNRTTERTQCAQVATLVSLHDQLRAEHSVREREDVAILDKLAASFHELQRSILESLGEEKEA